MSVSKPVKGGGMGAIRRFLEKMRKRSSERGYSCDGCGREVFDYPNARLCKDCESAQVRPIRTCSVCGRQTVADGVCLSCKKELPKFDRGLSPFVYHGKSALLINVMKNGKPRLAHYFGEAMADCFASAETVESVLIVPVPITEAKLRERGYNQAERLAEVVCERLKTLGFDAELIADVLVKTRETQAQKTMSFYERKENVVGAFFVHKRKACRDRTVVLVDDIMTTGATGSACALRLKKAGARKVVFLTATALEELK